VRLRHAIVGLLCLFACSTPAVGFAARGEASVAHTFAFDGGLAGTVVLGGANASRVTLDIDRFAEQYVITDVAGITAREGCTGVSSQTVRCTRYGSPGETFQARLRGGDDILEMLSDVADDLRLRGGEGADKLLAGPGTDELAGNAGADTLTGRAGPDRLFADRGKDRLIGGMGRDRLHADDDDSDRAINCGPGQDVVFLDRGRDPRPIRCERVRRA
jgi:Ca2+-binding RTX toxin-like protein